MRKIFLTNLYEYQENSYGKCEKNPQPHKIQHDKYKKTNAHQKMQTIKNTIQKESPVGLLS